MRNSIEGSRTSWPALSCNVSSVTLVTAGSVGGPAPPAPAVPETAVSSPNALAPPLLLPGADAGGNSSVV
ncbi:MAG: hypothetical protein ABI895_22790 [Deltaproteobacteria bacterium]